MKRASLTLAISLALIGVSNSQAAEILLPEKALAGEKIKIMISDAGADPLELTVSARDRETKIFDVKNDEVILPEQSGRVRLMLGLRKKGQTKYDDFKNLAVGVKAPEVAR